MSLVYYKNRICDESEVCIPSTNRAFKYADGFFEAIRIYDGFPVLWKYHYARLCATAKVYSVDMGCSESELKCVLRELIIANKLKHNAMIRLMIYRSGVGKYFPETNAAELFIELVSIESEFYASPVVSKRAIIFDRFKMPAYVLGNHKSLNKSLHILAAIQAQKQGCDDALLVNQNGHLAEAVSSNLYLIKGDLIITPPLADGGLNGTVRKVLLANQTMLGIRIKERSITNGDLGNFDEIWTSNAATGISAITSIGQYQYGSAKASNTQSKLRLIAVNSSSDFLGNQP